MTIETNRDLPRSLSFDIMKGIGIMAIIIGHLSQRFNGALFSFHVPLFFILAGYFFKERPFPNAIKKDAERLLLPYSLSCLIIIVASVFSALLFRRPFDPYWVIASFYGSGSFEHTSSLFAKMPVIGAIWFLLALFWCKQVFSFIKTSAPRYHFLICLGISIIASLVDSYLINLPFAVLPGLSALVFFSIGHLAKEHQILDRTAQCNGNRATVATIILIICILCWFIVLYLSHLAEIRLSIVRCFYKCYPLDVAGAVGGTYVVFLLSTLIDKYLSLFAYLIGWIGKNSIVFLCIHLIDLDLQFRHVFHIGDGIPGFLFTMAICTLAVFVINRIPSCAKLFKTARFVYQIR